MTWGAQISFFLGLLHIVGPAFYSKRIIYVWNSNFRLGQRSSFSTFILFFRRCSMLVEKWRLVIFSTLTNWRFSTNRYHFSCYANQFSRVFIKCVCFSVYCVLLTVIISSFLQLANSANDTSDFKQVFIVGRLQVPLKNGPSSLSHKSLKNSEMLKDMSLNEHLIVRRREYFEKNIYICPNEHNTRTINITNARSFKSYALW